MWQVEFHDLFTMFLLSLIHIASYNVMKWSLRTRRKCFTSYRKTRIKSVKRDHWFQSQAAIFVEDVRWLSLMGPNKENILREYLINSWEAPALTGSSCLYDFYTAGGEVTHTSSEACSLYNVGSVICRQLEMVTGLMQITTTAIYLHVQLKAECYFFRNGIARIAIFRIFCTIFCRLPKIVSKLFFGKKEVVI